VSVAPELSAKSGYNKGTIRIDIWYLVVSKDVRRHRLISIDYITTLSCHAEVASSSLVVPAIFSRSAGSIVVACHSSLLCLCCRNALVSGQPVGWKNHIASDPEILRGKPRLKGTRIPVGLVLGYLAAGKTAEDIIAEFPDVTRDQIAACLDYARELAEFEAVV
jgi:uncharacterized protein (DUF433 family)